MSNVLTFPGARFIRRRRKPPEVAAHIDRAIESALDFVDRLLAMRDRLEKDAEEAADAFHDLAERRSTDDEDGTPCA